jgi:hypothetical protein
MRKPSHRNGSGRFEIGQHDIGGWGKICAGRGNLPDDLPVYLSQTLSDWSRQCPNLHMRCVVPIQKDGDTMELHAWYDVHLFPATQGPEPEGGPG